ncbi:MAG TPA: Panacea domain-containing protein, partial [Elusimicrobiales bacterium]|nr:Panacea domain-containing protein [Elusimicrobiales bacterium]
PKATHLAAYLLMMRGNKMSYMKLIKLMYLVDRQSLLKRGRPITFDCYYSMKYGPVLSRTHDLITEDIAPEETTLWSKYISNPMGNKEVRLKKKPSFDELSNAEISIIKDIFRKYGHMKRWELVDLLHKNLPEWKDTKNSSIPIHYKDILKTSKKSKKEIEHIISDIESISTMDDILET